MIPERTIFVSRGITVVAFRKSVSAPKSCRNIVREACQDTTPSTTETNKSPVHCTANRLLSFFTAGNPADSEGDGKIPGGVAVDGEVEVFDVPQSNQGGNPGSGRPDGRYPSVYPNGGYPDLCPTLWYLVVYPIVG